MNSFLKRNIASTLFYNNYRNTSNKKNSSFNTLEKENSSKLLLTLNDRTINSIFKIIYFKEFPNILNINSKVFLQNINKKAEELIKKNTAQIVFSSEEIKSFISIGKEKVLVLYNEDYSFLKESFLNYQKNPKKYQFLKDNTLIHCIEKYNKYLYHKCNNGQYGNFISFYKNKDILYIICVKCKKSYKNNYINLYCNNCHKAYYGFLYKKIDINTSINRDIYLATWKKYHCGLINNEIMKCINCKNYFYYNIKTNKLICENKKCNFTSDPEYIIWKCSKCLKEFNSQVKPFNPYEYRIYKQELYYIILNKAKPNIIIKCLNCSKNINANNKIIYHSEKCKGELYSGKIFELNIIVCSKCLYSNYLDEFTWTCPFCNKKIKDKDEDKEIEDMNIKLKMNNNSDNNDNSLSFSKKFFSQRLSYNKIRTMRNYFKKENEAVRNNINKFNNKNKIKNLNIKTMKISSNNIRYNTIRNTNGVGTFKTLEKDKNIWFNKDVDTIHVLKTDTNAEKDSPVYSLTKNSLNNSYNSLFSQSRNSLQNKDRKTFHSIIIKMKNRIINSKNKKKYFNQTEENIKNAIDSNNIIENKKSIFIRTLNFPKIYMSKPIKIEKESEEDIKTIQVKNRVKIIKVKYNNELRNEEGKKSEDKNENKIISVRKTLTHKNSEKKFNIESKTSEIKSNKIITPQKKIKNPRGSIFPSP